MGLGRLWGTWEELILGSAVLRHGTRDWNVVALELRARTLYPYNFTPQACKYKYEDLQKRYSGSRAWFDELRKRRVAELKRELARSEDSIGSLESKIESLKAEKQQTNMTDISSHTESPLQLPPLNSDGTDSFIKETSKEHSAGSFTEDTGTRKTRPYETVTETKSETKVYSEQDKDLKLPEGGTGQVMTIRKRRGQRKRIMNCNQVLAEACMGESENLGSSNVDLFVKERSTDVCGPRIRDSGVVNHNGSSNHVLRDNLIEIFESVAETEPAGIFRHRMDSQKRARYRKVIRQHLDIGIIRSRISSHSIKTTKELFRDLLLLANNALVFYSKRTREYKSAFTLRNLVMKEYKQHCRWSYHEATSAFIPCNPPVKPRSARPRPQPRPPPCKEKKLPEKLCSVETIVPAMSAVVRKSSNLDCGVLEHYLLKGEKGLMKVVGKGRSGLLGDKRRKTSSPLKQKKKVKK